MIDWSKIGPAGSPAPTATQTTAPVAPAAPGGIPSLPAMPTATQAQPYQTGQGFHEASQAQVDAMDPFQRMGRGIDFLGEKLFGRGNGSPLGGVPLLGDIVGGIGNALHGAVDSTVIKPFEFGAQVAGRVPLGWLPGGADETFNKIGEWAKTKDPTIYQHWQTVNAAAGTDVLNGGNLKADFNMEVAKYLDDQQKDSSLGVSPELAMGREGVGSLGGAFAHAVNGWLGIAALGTQRWLGEQGVFDPGGFGGTSPEEFAKMQAAFNRDPNLVGEDARYVFQQLQSGKFTEQQARDYFAANVGAGRNRVEEAAARLDRGGEVSDVEKQAVEAWRSGAWSMAHAQDFIVSHGQSITRNLAGQIAGGVITDPLTVAAFAGGGVAKVGQIGARIADSGLQAETTFQKLATTVAAVQKSQLGPAFRIGRGMIDPLGVYKPSTIERATTDIVNAVSLSAFQRTYGPMDVSAIRSLARENNIGDLVDGAIFAYSRDKADEMIIQHAQTDMLQEYGHEMIAGQFLTPDETAALLRPYAGRDAETETVAHMQDVMKNTFTPEEQASLAGRMAASPFGHDVPYWEAALAKMPFNQKSALHAITSKLAEKDFMEAVGKVDKAAYTGSLPLDRLVLMTSDTLNLDRAAVISSNITDVLKSDLPDKIDAAVSEWNTQAARYPAMATIGFATGSDEQLKAMVKELDRLVSSGALPKRATEAELNDAAMRPVRDMLDRYGIQSDSIGVENPVPEGFTTNPNVAASGQTFPADIKREGLFHVTTGRDSLLADGKFRGSGEGAQGFGSGSDVAGQGRVSFLTDLARAQTYMDRMTIAVKAARGEMNREEILNVFRPLYEKAYPGEADKIMSNAVGSVVYKSATKPEDLYGMVRHLDGALTGPRLDTTEKAVMLVAPFADVAQVDPAQIAILRLATRERADVQKGIDLAELTIKPEDVTPLGVVGAEADKRYLYDVGFRPEESVAWGLKYDPVTGEPVVDRAPTISHTVDAVPGRQPFSDTTRNVIGQIIGPSKAERVNKPIDSIEAYVNTMRDGITGQRLVRNIQQRYERIAFDAGVPKPVSQMIFSKAREVAGWNATTIRGINPSNLWEQIAKDIPQDLVLKDGSRLNIHIVMDQLLRASEGDLRIMGLSSVLSQRIRNALRAHGDAANWSGQMTVTMYNKLRYSQPMFLIQRITDGPYYSILYGVQPVGGSKITSALNREMRLIEDNLGRTGFARDFSMDMPEFATRTNFTQGIKSAMQQRGLIDAQLEKIARAPDGIIAHNMTNMLSHRAGDIMKGALDNLETAAKADPALAAEMLESGNVLRQTLADVRGIYSQQAGRVLDDNEVAVRYFNDMLSGWRHTGVNPDGSLNFHDLITEGERAQPNSIGDIPPLRPDDLARELGSGYQDEAALRAAVTGHVEKIGQQFVNVPGEKSLASLEEDMRVKLGVSADYSRRAMAYFSDTWDGFWRRLARPVDEGGLDISPHYAKEAQDLIAMQARARGMNPWEYLSGVMSQNIGAKDMDTAIGELMAFLKSGKSKQPIEEWTKLFRAHLDVSAQRTLLQEFESATNIEDVIHVPTPGAFGRDHSGNAVLPAGFKAEAGYYYHVGKLDDVRSGIPARSGVGTTVDPAASTGTAGEGIFRFKATPKDLTRHKSPLTKNAVPPDQIEMLNRGGQWEQLGPDPMDTIMGKKFPEMVRKRLIDGKPHANPEVEAYIQAFSKWVQDNLQPELAGETRRHLRELTQKAAGNAPAITDVSRIPTGQASNYNRTHALIISLLKNKIDDAQRDVFRLAEMQTKRSMLERSMNHPLFALYPASYMWGKVLPETVKFIAKNPYAATYAIADVQRAIALQRAFDPEMDQKVGAVDRSAGAFLLDYLTPSLPWSDHQARMSPFVRDLLKGDPGLILPDELATVSPERWYQNVTRTIGEIPGAFDAVTQPEPPQPAWQGALQDIQGGGGAPGGPATPGTISGPTKAAALAPILQDDLERLSNILLAGQSPEK